MVTIEQYAREVRKMRNYQNRYFQTRNTYLLGQAKIQEKIVDDMSYEILNML